MALSLAQAVGGQFQRVQFTSDLLPSDVLGVSIYNPKTQAFEFKKGPLFHHIILADEINRASPKTQSALLEAMQEKQVSMDGQTFDLPHPFFVIATQNPHDHYGTFPLPESQLDRFMMRLHLGYPDPSFEMKILKTDSAAQSSLPAQSVASLEQVVQEGVKLKNVAVDESLDRYMVNLAQATRESPHVDLGLSPRGTLALRRASQAFALTASRTYVIPDDIRAVAVAVIAHRLRLKNRHLNGTKSVTEEAIVTELMNHVSIPV